MNDLTKSSVSSCYENKLDNDQYLIGYQKRQSSVTPLFSSTSDSTVKPVTSKSTLAVPLDEKTMRIVALQRTSSYP